MNINNAKIIERLAEFMGENWIKENTINGRLKLDCECGYEFTDFNPLKSWNHWRLIEDRLMEDGKSQLIKAFMKKFDGKFDYMGSDLEDRCMYLISVIEPELLNVNEEETEQPQAENSN